MIEKDQSEVLRCTVIQQNMVLQNHWKNVLKIYTIWELMELRFWQIHTLKIIQTRQMNG